jgi:hypothetical protein
MVQDLQQRHRLWQGIVASNRKKRQIQGSGSIKLLALRGALATSIEEYACGHSQDACVLAFTCISKVVELHPGKVSVNRVFAVRGVLGYIAYDGEEKSE